MSRPRKPLKWKEIECQYSELGTCWEVVSHSTTKDGYAQMGKDGKTVGVHRHIYEECFGEIPKGMVIMHKCDNPKCINPEHLMLGTQTDNNVDALKKRRCIRYTILSDEQVKAIR